MKRATIAVAMLALAITNAPAEETQRPLALIGATVIDATGAPPRPDMVVLVERGRITAIRPKPIGRLPRGTRRIDARGKFLIPGLWDMHVHGTLDHREWILPVYLANGITGLRHMGGEDLSRAEEFRSVREGTAMRIVTCLAIVDGGKSVWPNSLSVSSERDARQTVKRLKDQGADFIKVYSQLSRQAYLTVAQEARRLAIPFAGHVPTSLTAAEASEAGQASIEHLSGLKPDDPENAALFARFVKNRTWHCPTLVLAQAFAKGGDPRIILVSPRMRTSWKELLVTWGPAMEKARQLFPQTYFQLVGDLHKAGVRILAGTDVGMPYVVPGVSLHDELALLVQSGLTPMEALQTATRNPAEFLGLIKDLGTVEVGKLANLVLLDADPLAHIQNTRKIHAVILEGRFTSRKDLDVMLKRAVEVAADDWQ